MAAEPEPTAAGPSVGDPAPDVPLVDHDGKPLRLRDLRGKRVVLFFYPRDMTPGCTTEACGFQERLADLAAEGAVVVGASPDGETSHRKFRAEHGLAYTLATASTPALEAWGVWKEKSMYGRTFMGVERTTFLLGPDGRVEAVWRKVKPQGHAAEVLAALRG